MMQNRIRELEYLDRRYTRTGAEFVILYGRRRVGKSTLIYEWSKEKRSLYFFAARLPDHVLLGEFSQLVAQALGNTERTFPDWSSAFLALAELANDDKFIVVIDEYPYLADSVSGLSTVLQRAWDTSLQHTNLFLCLTGSSHSVMRREILDGDAPLYRRHTWTYELQPLHPSDYPHFLPNYRAEQLIETYAVLGGMPRNVTTINPKARLMRNIADEVLEVDVFTRVLATIAAGAHTRKEIASVTQGKLSSIQHYLNDLISIGAVEHRLPLTRVQSQKRHGTYHILDPFLRFWHRWVAPHHRLLEINQRQKETLDEIRNHLSYIVAPVWEEIARQHLLIASGTGQIPFSVQEIGSWWTRSAQIDVVGVNRQNHQVVFGEARWRSSNMTTKDLEILIEKGQAWLKGDTARWEVHYALFAKSVGQVTVEDMDDGFVHVFTPEDITSLDI